MQRRQKRIINLALQGGGSHGAFTWGVLDRLLEEPRFDFEGISGTSAGAMNAVMLAYGLTTGGREGARQALADFWERVGTWTPWGTAPAHSLAQFGLPNSELLPVSAVLGVTQILSPYQLNPLGLNPLREIVTDLIDFERLRAECEIKLFVAATQVRTGSLRLFDTKELTAGRPTGVSLPALAAPCDRD